MSPSEMTKSILGPSGDSWAGIYACLVKFVEDLASEIRVQGPVIEDLVRWRAESAGHYVVDKCHEWGATGKALGRAFHLPSFTALRSAIHASPAGPWVGKVVGPRSYGHNLNVEDFAFRTADLATTIGADGVVTTDLREVRRRVDDLRLAIEAPTVDVEVLTLLRRVWLRGTLSLGPDVELRRLEDAEIVDLIVLGMIAPRLQFDRYNDRPRGDVQIQESDRVALIRRVSEPNLSASDVAPSALDVPTIVQRDVGRLTDAIALLADQRVEVVGWRSRGSGSVLVSGGSGYQVLNPLGPPPYVSRTGFNVDADRDGFEKRWLQLVRAEHEEHGGAVRLATRRIGLAVGRESSEDRLVDGIVALEALLLAGEKPGRGIGGIIAGRVPILWPRDSNPKGLSKAIYEAYLTRDAVVHGEQVAAEDVERHAGVAIDVARVLARRRLDMKDETGSYKVDWASCTAEVRESRSAERLDRIRTKERQPLESHGGYRPIVDTART